MTHRVTIDDIRTAGHCARGVRRWFEDRGLDFPKFLREGMAEEELLALGDGLADEVVRMKREREGRPNG